MTVKIQYKLYSRKLKKRRENEESLNTTATQQKEKEAESKINGLTINGSYFWSNE